MVVVFAILLSFAANAGFLGIPLTLILGSWFFKYAYVLFDQVVRGVDEPPTLDIEMVNPVNEQRPLAQVIIAAAMAALLAFAAMKLPPPVTYGLAALAVLVFPASVAVLGLEGNLVKAIYPVALARMIAGLGLRYLAVVGVIGGVIAALGVLQALHLWLPVRLSLAMLAVLSIFSALAGALYDRRHELGLETWHSPERTAEKVREAQQRENERIVTEAYGLVRARAPVKAWQMLDDWLASRGRTPEDYAWLCGRVASWNDGRYAHRLNQEHVDRLLALKRNGEALDAVARRLRMDASFRPKTAAATLRVAQLAAGGGVPQVARRLLEDFGARFAGDPLAETAQTLARRLDEGSR